MYKVGDKLVCYNNMKNGYKIDVLTISNMYTIIEVYKFGCSFYDDNKYYNYYSFDVCNKFFYNLQDDRRRKLIKLKNYD